MMTTSDNEVLQQVLGCLQSLREEQLKLSMQVRQFDSVFLVGLGLSPSLLTHDFTNPWRRLILLC